MTPAEIKKQKQQARSFYNQARMPEALNILNVICQQHPDEESLCLAGLVYARMNNPQMALRLLSASLNMNQGYEPAWSGLGNVQAMQGQHQAALESFQRAVSIDPKNVLTLINMANLQRELGMLDEAENNYRQALKLDRRNTLALNNIANIYLARCQYDLAEKHYKQAIKLDREYYDAHYNLGATFQNKGDHKQAIRYYKLAQQLRPGDPAPQIAIANSYEKQGRREESAAILEPLFQRNQATPDAADIYARICKSTGEYDKGIDILERALSPPLQPIHEQAIRFCLGDLLDKRKEYDAAMEQYVKANSMRPYHYDRTAYERYFDSIRNTFRSLADRFEGAGLEGERSPIFVVGMPRSGTTLVEQILASHSQVNGAGELPYLGELSSLGTSTAYPDSLLAAGAGQLRRTAEQYLGLLKGHAHGCPRIVDKMPHNFLYVGLIRLMYPDSTVINCIRNPLDVCLSIYFHNFNQNHPYTDDLSSLGHYYNLYRDLVQFWQSSCGDFVTDIRYEELLSDPERTTRNMLEHAGLEWEDACLRFYENRRTVSTPSYSQVTQPLYTSSKERWRRYSAHIDSLRAAIRDDYLYPEDDA